MGKAKTYGLLNLRGKLVLNTNKITALPKIKIRRR
jgi:hypothetical protein